MPQPICFAATKTIAWSTHSYKPMTLKAGTLVTFKWSGFHNVAVSKLNEKSTRSECSAACTNCIICLLAIIIALLTCQDFHSTNMRGGCVYTAPYVAREHVQQLDLSTR